MTAPARIGSRELAADVLAYTAGVIMLTLAMTGRSVPELLIGLIFVWMASLDGWRWWRRRAHSGDGYIEGDGTCG